MLRCKNKTFNKFLFFSFVFFIISFFVNTVIVYAGSNEQEDTTLKEESESLKDSTFRIQIQQEQIIEQLEEVERKL